MARTPVLAAGGIVLRQQATPLIAVVRLRKRNEWVLPKGKLDDGETPRAAAEREVMEETGHDVAVHEFLGTLVYESGGRSRVVHYWRMEANGGPAHELMDDVRAVDWLPLEAAVERLSRSYERAFLANVGPLALEAAARARLARRRAKQPVLEKRRAKPAIVPQPSHAEPMPDPPQPDPMAAGTVGDEPSLVADDIAVITTAPAEAGIPVDPIETLVDPTPFDTAAQSVEDSAEPAMERDPVDTDTAHGRRRNLVQKMRDWLRRAA
jgi:8-oxo-dGTP diphosphatase